MSSPPRIPSLTRFNIQAMNLNQESNQINSSNLNNSLNMNRESSDPEFPNFSEPGLIDNIDELIERNIAEREEAELQAAIAANALDNQIKPSAPPIEQVLLHECSNENHELFNDLSGFFYIIQTADVPIGVYKIGKTARANPNQRLCEYPKFSSVKYTIAVNDCHGFESYAMRKFRTLFKRRREFGLEYYEGNLMQMINLAHKLWNKYGLADKIVVDQNIEKIKPVGWQFFVNEWYSDQFDPTPDEAYDMYVSLIKSTFNSDEVASKQVFITYLNYILG